MFSTRHDYRWFLAALGTPLLAAWVGCGRSASTAPPAASAAAARSEAQSLDPGDRQLWQIFYLQGSRAGYGQTTIRPRRQSGQDVVLVEGLNYILVKREGQPTEQEIRFNTVETPDGRLLQFDSEIRSGPVPVRTSGCVEGSQMRLTTVSQGKSIDSSTAWKPEYGGPFAVELSLMRQPMQPGERRTVHTLVPGANEVAVAQMKAGGYESVKLPRGAVELLRVDVAMRFPGGTTLPETHWTDRTGKTLKTHSDLLNLESFTSTKAEAMDRKEVGELDLTESLSVAIPRRLTLGHAAHEIRYRVTLQDGDPAAVFVSGGSQQVQAIDAHTARITAYAVRPGQPAPGPARDDPPTDDDRQPNNMIQSDDPAVVAMAREAAGTEQDPWRTALALESYVHRIITKKDFSQAFATAAEVARSREGDCTEHAVLLAALARARGIPARVAIGLVYVAHSRSFAYHMWTEVAIDKQWIPMDATLARGGIGGAHLKLANSTLKGASAYSSFLPVVQVIGRLKIEVEEEK